MRRIRPTADGTTWFCSDKWPNRTFTGGLTALRHGQWRVYRARDGLPSDHVYNFFEDSKRRGFALTDKGVAQKTGESWRRVIDEAVWDLVETTNGCVMGFSGDKCYRLEGDEWTATAYPALHFNRHPPKGLCLTSRGDLLAYGEGRWNGRQFEPLGPLSMVDVIPRRFARRPMGRFGVWT